MIYVTGDTHGEFRERLTPGCTPGEEKWTADDKLIVTGDFGLIFYPKMEPFAHRLREEKEDLAFLEAKPYEILFVDGNHENFDRLEAEFPDEERWGGTVKRLGRNIFWLRRGQIYTIEGHTFFCMGGAYSLDKARRLNYDHSILAHYENSPMRHLSWWPQEQPDDREYRLAAANLEKYGKKVDYVLTHEAPGCVIRMMRRAPDEHEAELCGFLDWVWYEADFRHWFFGHWHIDADVVEGRATALYFDVCRIPEENERQGD